MRTQALQSLVLTSIFCLGACSASVELYPVKGPYSEQTNKPIIHATAHGVMGNTGRFVVTLPNNETCEGRWSSAAGVMVASGTGTLFSQYGSLVGFGTAISNVPGVNRGEAMSFCPSGRSLEAEFYTGSGTANGYGIARDSEGNVYKMLF
jgi:hypothetical protein